jgi:hypothetical protein
VLRYGSSKEQTSVIRISVNLGLTLFIVTRVTDRTAPLNRGCRHLHSVHASSHLHHMAESRLSRAELLDDIVECLQVSRIGNKYRDCTSGSDNSTAIANALYSVCMPASYSEIQIRYPAIHNTFVQLNILHLNGVSYQAICNYIDLNSLNCAVVLRFTFRSWNTLDSSSFSFVMWSPL